MLRQPSHPDPDQDLVVRAQDGDTRAFDALILKYGDKLFGLVFSMTNQHEDTHDLLQEIFAKAYQSLPSFKGNSTFYTWIYQIASNRTLNFLKKRKLRPTTNIDELSPTLESALIDNTTNTNPEHRSKIKELNSQIKKAMMNLSEKHRIVVTLFDVQGLSHSEIAKILKTSEGTVRSRLHYAHQMLQAELKDLWNERF
jgi:RNA polymerase sigma factor (sigma-70 family)